MTDDRRHEIREALLAAEDGLVAEQPPVPGWTAAVRRGLVLRRRRQQVAAFGLAGLLVLGGAGVVYAVSAGSGDSLVAVAPSQSPTPPSPVPSPDPSPSGEPTAEPTTEPSPVRLPPPPAPSPSADACAPAFRANTLRDTGEPSGHQLGLESVTASLQDDFDRVVFTLAGSDGRPGWTVEYVDDPRSDGSGDPVAVDGERTLQVLIHNIGTPDDTGVPYPADRRFSPGDTEVVEQVVVDTLFEGYLSSFIGTHAELPFRVFTLANPTRLVVEVRHC